MVAAAVVLASNLHGFSAGGVGDEEATKYEAVQIPIELK
jgi:hypothetical protein